MLKKPLSKKPLVLLMTAALFSGCSTIPDQFQDDFNVMNDGSAAGDIIKRGMKSDHKPAIEYRAYDVNKYFSISRMNPSDPLPDVGKQTLSVSNASIYDSLRILLLDLGINLSMSHETATKTGMYMAHGDGTLPDIINGIAEATDLFYTYKNNTLSFSETESFVFKVPPMLGEDSEKDILETLMSLGVEKASIDTRFNTVTFKSTKNNFKGIEAYLKNIAESGSVIVFDSWIWEVNLNENNKSGIQWENFGVTGGNGALNLSGGSSSAIDAANDLLGAITYTSDNLSISGLVSFLKRHGSLSTLSQPKISLISGSKAKLEVGEELKYVSELTSTTSSTGDTTQSSAETDTLSTGLKMNIYGVYEGGSVYSNVSLEVSDLLRFNDFSASGTTLSLPHTVIRKVESDTRVEPGEYFIVGGVNMNRKQNDDEGAPSFFGIEGISLPFSKSKEISKSELVIVMRPRVIIFDTEKMEAELARQAKIEAKRLEEERKEKERLEKERKKQEALKKAAEEKSERQKPAESNQVKPVEKAEPKAYGNSKKANSKKKSTESSKEDK